MLNNRRVMSVSCRRVDIPLPSARASPLTAVHFPCTNCFTISARHFLSRTSPLRSQDNSIREALSVERPLGTTHRRTRILLNLGSPLPLPLCTFPLPLFYSRTPALPLDYLFLLGHLAQHPSRFDSAPAVAPSSQYIHLDSEHILPYITARVCRRRNQISLIFLYFYFFFSP